MARGSERAMASMSHRAGRAARYAGRNGMNERNGVNGIKSRVRTRMFAAEAVRQTLELQGTELGWDALAASADDRAGGGASSYQVRPGQVPGSSPDAMRASGSGSGGSDNIDEVTKLPGEGFTIQSENAVLFYRDTNSWCPFCERIWLALLEKGIKFESVGVDLRDKPEWYSEMIPTALVPSVRVFPEDELVYESKDILLKLEERFGGEDGYKSLLPRAGAPMRARAEELLNALEDDDIVQKGFRVLLADRATEGSLDVDTEDRRGVFLGALASFERTLAENGGPFVLGATVSLVDIMLIPGLIRLSANLRTFAGLEIRFNDSYPHVRRWFASVDDLESVQSVRSDDETLNAVVGKIFMNNACFDVPPRELLTPPLSLSGKREAASKLIKNNRRVVDDILMNAGLPESVSRDIVDGWTRALAATLLGKEIQPKADQGAKAVGAAVFMFLRNRVSAPRDMSAAAAVAFRDGADKIARSIY